MQQSQSNISLAPHEETKWLLQLHHVKSWRETAPGEKQI